MKLKFVFIFSFLIMTLNAYTEEMSFPKIWEMIAKNSSETKSIQLTKESSDKAVDRLSRYWMPTLYANSQLILTNDPTLTFMNYLGEGEIRQNDFITSNLNSPSSHVFNSNQIGIDFLLYDGSGRESYLNSQKHFSDALTFEQKNILLKEYVNSLKGYSKIVLFKSLNHEIKPIENELQKIIKNYHIGEKSNPIGYSGLLSLKSLKNKLDYINEETSNKIQNQVSSLNILAGNREQAWEPTSIPLDKFISIYFFTTENNQKSNQYQAEVEKYNSIKEKISGEKSKYLPKIGLFSQANVYDGERGINSAYVIGAYLKFNFSPSEYGSADEIELLSKAKIEEANAVVLNESVSKKVSEENIKAAKNKINLIQNDEEITDEQIRVFVNLFKNGNMNISQVADLLNKRIDLLVNKYSLKEFLLNSNLELVSLTNKSVDPNDIWSLK